MKFEELKTKYENQEDVINQLEVKKYISLGDKEFIANKIVELCIKPSEINPGILELKYVDELISIATYTIGYYTNLELGEKTAYEELDWLRSNGIYESIRVAIGTDLWEFEEIIDKEVENILKAKNSIEGIITSTVNTLITKIPDEKQVTKIIDKLTKKFEKFAKNMKPEQLQQFKTMLTPVKK